MTAKITRRGFAAWLKKQDPKRRFVKQNSCNCPLATYLAERRGGPGKASGLGIAVSSAMARVNTPGKCDVFVLPGWARIFVKEVDLGAFPGDPISPAQALKILERVS